MKIQTLFASIFLLVVVTLTPVHAALVATLPTDVSTTNTGQAVYKLPFDVPAGTGGIQPELGISYRSGSGSGIMGAGFSLSGLSSITRVPTALDPDGFIDGVDLDDNDQFSMDGKRLICIAGTPNSDGAEYRTEIDTFAKIIAHGVAGEQGAGYFEVKTKNGLTMWYGQANNSAFRVTYTPPTGSAITGRVVYNLSKVEDSLGNKIEYYYTIDSNKQQLLDRIDYSYVNGSPTYQIQFVYKAKPYPTFSYVLGTKITDDQILDRIQCKFVGNSTPIWEYIISYKTQGAKSVLQVNGIQQNAMGVSAGSLDFEWDNESLEGDFGWSRDTGYDVPFDLETTNPYNSYTKRDHEFVDLNGDGLLDLLSFGHSGDGSSRLNTGSGWVETSAYDAPYEFEEVHQGDGERQNYQLLDLDGDGLVDIQALDLASGSVGSYLNNGSGWDAAPAYNAPFQLDRAISRYIGRAYRNHEFIDLNGDGLIDLQSYDLPSGSTGSYLNNGTGWVRATQYDPDFALRESHTQPRAYRNFEWLDLNVDGLPDLVAYDPAAGVAVGTYFNDGGNGWLRTSSHDVPFELTETHSYLTRKQNHIFFDLDGDGRVDLQAYDLASGSIGSYLNKETGWVAAAGFNAPFLLKESHPNKHYLSRNHQFIDLNGDGLMDLQAFGANYESTDSYLNSGSQWVRAPGYDAPYNLYETHPSVADYRNHELVDLNGDGLPDLLCTAYPFSTTGSYLNTGEGWLRYSDYDPPFKMYENHPALGRYRNHRLLDLNGDGLPDIMGFHAADGARKSYLNNGKKWVLESDYDSAFQLKAMHPDGTTPDNHLFLDLDGDGLSDYIALDDSLVASEGFYRNHARTTRLNKVTNNFENQSRIEYGTTGDRSIYTRGFGAVYPIVDVIDPTVVVTSISKDAGLNDSDGDPIFYTTEYTYAEARYHRQGRGFLGYRVFESYDTETTLSKSEILAQDFPWVGMPLSVETRGPNGQLLSRTVNGLNAKMLNEYLDGGQTKYRTLFPYFDSSEEWAAEYDPAVNFPDETGRVAHLETNVHSHTLAENEFDIHGNNIEIAVFYDADNGRTPNDNGTPLDPDDDFTDYYSQNYQITTNWFEQDDEDDWFLGRLTKSTIQSAIPHASGSGLDEQIRTSSYVYSTSTGHLMEETIEPGHPTLELRTVYTRDSYGNIESQTQHPAGLPARTVLTHSDLDATGRFFETSSNALSQSRGTSYYPELGLPQTVTGINGRDTDYTYDELGRPTRVVRPDATETSITYALDASITVDCDPNDPTSSFIQSVYKVTTQATEQATTVVWYDRLGRAIRSQSESFEGQLVNVDSLFNEVGLATCISLPYFATASPQYWTKNRYDLMGRVEEREAADGTIEKIIYDGLATTTLKNYAPSGTANNQNQKQITEKNVRGQVVSETSFLQTSPLTLHYSYDAFGNLVRTTDPENNIIAMRYDIRGNRTGMDDPDMGFVGTPDDDDWGWTYAFDALGRLTDQTDAKGQVTHYQYDALDRKTHETWHHDTPEAKTAHWYYDGDTWHDELGALRLEVSPDGHRTSFYYDELGRSFLTLRKIDDQYYYSTTVYDDYSRPDIVTEYWRPNALRDLPEQHHLAWKSFGLKYNYNARSLVESITDAQGHTWWDNPEFDAHGKLLSYDLGNGLTSQMSYHPARQTIESIQTGIGQGSTIQNLSFAHDAIGNLTFRSDAHADAGSGRTEAFTYDRLNRIETTVVAGLPTVEVVYDALGNITSRDRIKPDGVAVNMVYTYGSSRPHAVTSVTNTGRSSGDYGYNANGSLIARAESAQNIFWNGFNKPDIIATANYSNTFSYGANRDRVYTITKEAGLNTRRQLYAGSLEQEEIWDASLDGGNGDWSLQRTRVYIGTPAGTIGTWIEELTPDPLGGDPTLTRTRNYLHKDHIGSITAITDVNGTLVERSSFDVWGNQRDPDTWLPIDEATVATQAEANSAITDRGYTGHEQLDELGLIHMNGRIYDPVIAKMLSADPTIPNPSDLQAYNRYAYVLNNPLRYTDPSGFSSEEDKDQNAPVENNEGGGELSESVTVEFIHEGEQIDGVPLRDSSIDTNEEGFSEGNTPYKTRETVISNSRGTSIYRVVFSTTQTETGHITKLAYGAVHVGYSELGEGGSSSFQDKLTSFEMTEYTSKVDYTAEGFNEQVTQHSISGTLGEGVTNESYTNSSRSVVFTEMNQGESGANTNITLRDVGEFAASFAPYGGAIVALANGDFRGAAIEAAIETAFLATGAGFAVLKTAKAAKNIAKATNKGLSKIDDFVDLTKHRKDHILNRHASGAGKAGRTEFPSGWSNDRILHQVSDVATDPNAARGVGKWNSPYAIGTRDGIDIRVDFYPNNHAKYPGQISTAYPINMTPNP